MSNDKPQGYIPALTGVRAIAAFLVFIHHYYPFTDDELPHGLNRFFSEFHIGVTIFFVLSGFLIAFRYYESFQLNVNWFKQYIKNRIARIYPMYFLLTLFTFIVCYYANDRGILGGLNNAFVAFIANITFLRGFFDQLKFTGVAQGWSLTVEECFYLAAPFIFFLVKNKHVKLILLPFLVTGIGFLLVLAFSRVDFYGFFGNNTFMMLYTFLGRAFEFFAGIALAIYLKKNAGNLFRSKISLTYTGFALIMVCVWVISLLPIPKGQFVGLQHPMGIITNNYLLPIAIILWFYGLVTENTIFKKLISTKFVELLGKSSYIFYLIHSGVIAHALYTWLGDGRESTIPVFIILNVISIILFKTIEEPLNNYIRRSNFLIKSNR